MKINNTFRSEYDNEELNEQINKEECERDNVNLTFNMIYGDMEGYLMNTKMYRRKMEILNEFYNSEEECKSVDENYLILNLNECMTDTRLSINMIEKRIKIFEEEKKDILNNRKKVNDTLINLKNIMGIEKVIKDKDILKIISNFNIECDNENHHNENKENILYMNNEDEESKSVVNLDYKLIRNKLNELSNDFEKEYIIERIKSIQESLSSTKNAKNIYNELLMLGKRRKYCPLCSKRFRNDEEQKYEEKLTYFVRGVSKYDM